MGTLIFYALVVAVYAILVVEFNEKFVDKKRIKKFQEDMKEINKRFKEAAKKKDSAAMERINAEQMAKAKEMPFLLKEQLKMTLLSIALFFLALWVLNSFDPSVADDINLLTLPHFNATHIYHVNNSGRHILSFKAKKNGKEYKGEIVYAVGQSVDGLNPGFEKDGFHINMSKPVFKLGEPVKIETNADEFLELKDDNGTRAELWISFGSFGFWIHGIWLFIAFSLVFNLLYAQIRKLIFPKADKKDVKESYAGKEEGVIEGDGKGRDGSNV